MKRRYPNLKAVFLSMFLLGGCSSHKMKPHSPEMTLAVATDLHYIAPELTDQGPCFQRSIEAADGKLRCMRKN